MNPVPTEIDFSLVSPLRLCVFAVQNLFQSCMDEEKITMPKRRQDDDYEDDYYSYYPESRPIRVEGGIQSRSKSGKFGENWWAKRWLQVLEMYGLGTRLQRGRSYARQGQVLSIDIRPGEVMAKVQGSRPTPYKVYIILPSLQESQWERVLDAISQQAIFAAQLLSGEMPQEIEQAFTSANVPLFPLKGSEIITSCNCPDDANPCKHIAAVYYLLGEKFDTDPFFLFTLRGRTREQIMEGLRKRRAQAAAVEGVIEEAEDAPEPVPTLADQIAEFWGGNIDFAVTFEEPEIEAAVLRRLGTAPAGAHRDLERLYRAMTTYTLTQVYEEK
jgi:uncharacterized Zn finger protein